MIHKNNNRIVELMRKSVGLPAKKGSACCGAPAAPSDDAATSCCDSGKAENPSPAPVKKP